MSFVFSSDVPDLVLDRSDTVSPDIPSDDVLCTPRLSRLDLHSIHPLYPLRNRDDILLITGDDAGFYVQKAWLVEASGFFRDFEQVSKASCKAGLDSMRSVEMRELPSATAEGLHLVLYVFEKTAELKRNAAKAVCCGCIASKSARKEMQTIWPENKIWDCLFEAIVTADAYQFDNFVSYLCPLLPDNPHFQYLSVALQSLRVSAEWRAEQLSYQLEPMPPQMELILRSCAPAYLSLYQAMRTAAIRLESAWKHPSLPPDYLDQFTDLCKESNGCATVQAFGDFAAYRQYACQQAFSVLRHKSHYKSWFELEKGLKASIPACVFCRDSLCATFEWIWSIYLSEWRPDMTTSCARIPWPRLISAPRSLL
nr:hypothetical protein L204_02002 [Cryptococcus depauperatus CBS 7855]